PISTETFILYNNKDLVDPYLGGKIPQTMDALDTAADLITQDPDGKPYGSVLRRLRSNGIRDPLTAVTANAIGEPAAVVPSSNVWFDGVFSNPRLADEAIVEGMDAYSRLVAAGPANALAIDWPAATALFAQGQAAFFLDA